MLISQIFSRHTPVNLATRCINRAWKSFFKLVCGIMEYTTQPGNRANSLYYFIGGHCYLRNWLQNNFIYMRCHHHPLFTGAAKISVETNLAALIKLHVCESTVAKTSSDDPGPRRMSSPTRLECHICHNNCYENLRNIYCDLIQFEISLCWI